jgi:hypothetical protein
MTPSKSRTPATSLRSAKERRKLTIDHGWPEVAQTALDFVQRFVPAKPS